MFNAYEFIYDGISSSSFGMMMYEFDGNGQSAVSFGNKASIIESRTYNHIRPIHYGVDYNGTPLEFKLIFGADSALSRTQLEAVAMWLTGSQEYKWLQICQPDLADVYYKCIVTQLTPIFHGWLPVAFEAEFRCDCPYAYSEPFEEVYHFTGTSASPYQIIFDNKSTINDYFKPMFVYTPSGSTTLKMINHSDNDRVFCLENLPLTTGQSVVVDSENCIMTESSGTHNIYECLNPFHFFRLVRGENRIDLIGSGNLTITGRFYRNVGG